MRSGRFLTVALIMGVFGAAGAPESARAADKAELSGLSDVAFGLILGTADQTASQSVCAYTSSKTELYSVTATGSGSGGAFALSSGAAQLPYDVLWADAPGQTGGTSLAAGTLTPGFASNAKQHTCNAGPSTTASLTIVIRSAKLLSARAGDYAGTLQITIAPE